MERSEYMKDIHRWENMRLNILTFKKKKRKKRRVSHRCTFVSLCVLIVVIKIIGNLSPCVVQ